MLGPSPPRQLGPQHTGIWQGARPPSPPPGQRGPQVMAGFLMRSHCGQVVGGRVSWKPLLPEWEPRLPTLPPVTAGTPAPLLSTPPFPPCPAHLEGARCRTCPLQGGQACLSKLPRGVGGRRGLGRPQNGAS